MSQQSPEKSVSVVIPAFNEEKLIHSTLMALYDQHGINEFETIVVDNGSLDATREKIEQFRQEYDDFPLTVIEEPTKGTGAAARSGFEYAINRLGSSIIARTDADCVPVPGWLAAGVKHVTKPGKVVASGPIGVRQDDEFYKPLDTLMWPISCGLGRIAYTLVQRDPTVFVYPPGGNTIIDAAAYEQVGGYPPSSIDDQCEDADLARRLRTEFGLRSFAWSRDIKVKTSMRRRRAIGALGALQCYVLHPDDKEVRLKANQGIIDRR
jgi:glycosyltransferase involved in cell wall biosynthesis